MKKWAVALAVFCAGTSFAEFRIWENTKGDVWEAEFVAMSGGLVVMRDQAGRKTEMRPETLCAADLEYLERRVPPKLNINVSKTTDNAGSGNAREYVKCLASLRQVDTKAYTGELTAVLVIMGEDIRTGAMSIAGKSEQTFTLPENRGQTVEFESKRATFYRRSQKGGRAYGGYLVVIWDRFGNPVAIESNRAAYEERATKLAARSLAARNKEGGS